MQELVVDVAVECSWGKLLFTGNGKRLSCINIFFLMQSLCC